MQYIVDLSLRFCHDGYLCYVWSKEPGKHLFHECSCAVLLSHSKVVEVFATESTYPHGYMIVYTDYASCVLITGSTCFSLCRFIASLKQHCGQPGGPSKCVSPDELHQNMKGM